MLLSLKVYVIFWGKNSRIKKWKNVLKLRQLDTVRLDKNLIFRLLTHDLLAANVWDFPHLRASATYSEMT